MLPSVAVAGRGRGGRGSLFGSKYDPLPALPRLLHPVADGGLPTTINQVCPITVWGDRLQAGGMTF